MKIIQNWTEIGIHAGSKNKIKARCPECNEQRSNKRDKSLSVNTINGVAHCHYCGITYLIDNKNRENNIYKMDKNYMQPEWKNNTELSENVVKWFESRGIKQSTLQNMQIGEGLEYMPQHNKQVNTIQFHYFEGGKLVNTKYRTGAKDFKFISNAELVPYNIDGVKNQEKIYITEGEMDALTLIQLGYPAISVPNGASDNTAYLDRFMDPFLMNLKEVIIAVDTDTKGVILREALIRRFGVEKCKLVDSWGNGCKDANECLMLYGAPGVHAMVSSANFIPVSGIFTVTDFEDDLDLLYEQGMKPGLVIGHPYFDELCSFETKRICVITGIPGSGKSEFMDEIAERLNMRYGWKFGYFSPENFPLKYHASKIISKITGKEFSKESLPASEYKQAKEYMSDNFHFICPDENYTLDTILEKARFLVRRFGVRGIVIDPWNRLEHQIPPAMTETNYIGACMDKLTNFAQREDVLVFIMAHPNKLKKRLGELEYDPPTGYDVAGSANFINKTDYGICVHRRKPLGYTEVHVQKVKFRHLGNTGVAKFKFNPFNGRYISINSESDPVVWEKENHLTSKN